MSDDHPESPLNDQKYKVIFLSFILLVNIIINNNKKHVDKSILPKSESLKDMEKRLLPYWHDTIVPEIKVI